MTLPIAPAPAYYCPWPTACDCSWPDCIRLIGVYLPFVYFYLRLSLPETAVRMCVVIRSHLLCQILLCKNSVFFCCQLCIGQAKYPFSLGTAHKTCGGEVKGFEGKKSGNYENYGY